MKNKIHFFTLLLICIGLVSFFSCQKEETVTTTTQFDFKAYHLELKNNPYYSDYIDAQTVFFEQIENHEIDLTAIYHVLSSQENPRLSLKNFELFQHVQGIEKFWSTYFDMRDKKFAFVKNTELNQNLSKDELTKIFTAVNHEVNDNITSRVSCAYVFTELYGSLYGNCLEDSEGGVSDEMLCEDFAMMNALGVYDNCCNSGGSC